jgi:hypothetical protein
MNVIFTKWCGQYLTLRILKNLDHQKIALVKNPRKTRQDPLQIFFHYKIFSMKRLLTALIPLALVFGGCQKEVAPTPDRTSVDQEKFGRVENGVRKPLKLLLHSVAVESEDRIQCLPEKYGDVTFPILSMVGGSGTHFGEVQMNKSTLIFNGCQFGPKPGQVTTPGHGTLTADNGDEAYYETVCTYEGSDFSFTGTVTITGGTGRFMDCYGEMFAKGKVDKGNGTAEWTNEGYIIIKK